jgi:hypothetical protein
MKLALKYLQIIFIVFALLLLFAGCRIFNSSFRDKDYFKITRGTLSFFETSFDIVRSAGDSCYQIHLLPAYPEKSTSDLGVLLKLDQKTFSRDFYSGAAHDGSLEQIESVSFYFTDTKHRFLLDSFNKIMTTKMVRRTFLNDKESSVLHDGKWWIDIPATPCKPTTYFCSIGGFCGLFNTSSQKLDLINQFEFLFQFKKEFYSQLNFKPAYLACDLILRIPGSLRKRTVHIVRNAQQSNFEYYKKVGEARYEKIN